MAKARGRKPFNAYLPSVLAAALLATYTILFISLQPFARKDTDRYFHYAIARATAENGLVQALPQADDLGWDKLFYEKEFLFHALGGNGASSRRSTRSGGTLFRRNTGAAAKPASTSRPVSRPNTAGHALGAGRRTGNIPCTR